MKPDFFSWFLFCLLIGMFAVYYFGTLAWALWRLYKDFKRARKVWPENSDE